jgi:hypothetical protein
LEPEGGTLLVLVQPGETSAEAVTRTAAGLGRPVEAFNRVIVLSFQRPG